MRTARFFVPEEWIAGKAKAFSVPVGPIHHQMSRVLRMKIGDTVSLLTGDGKEIEGTVTDITKTSIMGTIVKTSSHPDPQPHVTICAATTKRDTYEWALRKCTELGAAAFVPLHTERVIKKVTSVPRRWHDLVRESSEQSGRVTLPVIHSPMNLSEALGMHKKATKIAFHETGGKALPSIHKTTHVALFIGPEGGFSDGEIEELKAAEAHIVTCGELVLRAETAAMVGMTLLRFTK